MFKWEWWKKGSFLFWKKPCRHCGCRITIVVNHYFGAKKVSYPSCIDCVEREAVV